MNNQNQNLEARGVSLTPAQWERCDRLTDEYGKRSRNAFIREAVDGVGVDGNVIINGIEWLYWKNYYFILFRVALLLHFVQYNY